MNAVSPAAILLLAAALAIPVAGSDEVRGTPEHVVGENPYPFDTVERRAPERKPIELPDSVAPKLALLTESEIAFLESGDARTLAGSLDETVEALEERTPEEVKEWVNAMQHVVSHSRYEEGRDQPNVRFNTDSPEFNAWKTRRPRSLDPVREDGPVELGR